MLKLLVRKWQMAQFLDGRVSAVIGSHQQIPTADLQILDKGTRLPDGCWYVW